MRLPVNRTWPLAALALLSACGGGASVKDLPPPAANGPAADYPMVLGTPFTVDGVTYTPADTLNYDAVGLAGISTEGGASVSGSHRTLPLPSYVEVTALDTGKTILVRMERRGPMSGAQLIDLSPGAAAQLGLTGAGRNAVRVRRVNPPEVERAMLRSGQQAPARMDTPRSLLGVLQRKLDQQMGIATPAPVVEPTPVPAPVSTPLPVEKPAAKAPMPQPAPKAEKAKINKPKVDNPKVEKPKAAPATAAPKAAEPTKAAAAEKPAGKGVSYVQIGTFASKANAEAAAKKAGGSVVAAGKLWRVRTGPHADADKARAALAKARAAGYSDARIQHAD
ncbi:MAG: SPOR domain-containing protein [Proteobacteria bacterium]|nr:SPOR domain-containing protein [Pseudomonadota bacterium]